MRKNIAYNEIQKESEQLKVLVQNGFLQSGAEIDDLESMLNILSAPSVKQLCQIMNISKGNTREDCIKSLINHSKKRSFFTTQVRYFMIICEHRTKCLKFHFLSSPKFYLGELLILLHPVWYYFG